MNQFLFCLPLLLLFAFPVAAQPTCFVNFDPRDLCPVRYPRATSLVDDDLIFVGRVIALREIQRNEPQTSETPVDSIHGSVRGKAVLAVETLLKGEAPSQLEVRLSYGCWGSIEKDRRYLFQVQRQNGALFSPRWSHELEAQYDVAWALERIRSILRQEPQPRVFGRLLHRGEPVGRTTILAEKDGRKFRTRTNAEGRYAFRDLPDGEYRVYPLLPPWLRPPDGDDRLPREQYDTRAQVLQHSPCGARTDFVAWDNGVIAGRVEDADGHPVTPVALILWSLIDENRRQSFSYPAQEVSGLGTGEFAFINLPPGPYDIFVGFQGRPGPYTYLYYPGAVADEEQVRPIQLSRGQKLRNLVIRLPRAERLLNYRRPPPAGRHGRPPLTALAPLLLAAFPNPT